MPELPGSSAKLRIARHIPCPRLARLVEFEYLIPHRSVRGQTFRFIRPLLGHAEISIPKVYTLVSIQ